MLLQSMVWARHRRAGIQHPFPVPIDRGAGFSGGAPGATGALSPFKAALITVIELQWGASAGDARPAGLLPPHDVFRENARGNNISQLNHDHLLLCVGAGCGAVPSGLVALGH